MTTQLYLAPAGHGKTTYALERIRRVRAAEPLAPVTMVLPNQSQVAAFRQRLSAEGGALGVTLSTFYTLYAEVLGWAGKLEPRLPEPVQFRLLRHLIANLTDQGALPHYAPLRDKPGFVTAARAPGRTQAGPRSSRRLQTGRPNPGRGRDPPGRTGRDLRGLPGLALRPRLAALALERQPDLGRHLRLLLTDGFDEFNPTQLGVLKILAERAGETVIILIGEVAGRGAEEQGASGSTPPVLLVFLNVGQAVQILEHEAHES